MKPNRYPITIPSIDLLAYLRSVGAVRGPFGWILPGQINVWETASPLRSTAGQVL